MCQHLEVLWDKYMGLSEIMARKSPPVLIIFRIEVPLGGTPRFQTHLNFQFASEVHMGARTLHPASEAWQSWSLPDKACAASAMIYSIWVCLRMGHTVYPRELG